MAIYCDFDGYLPNKIEDDELSLTDKIVVFEYSITMIYNCYPMRPFYFHDCTKPLLKIYEIVGSQKSLNLFENRIHDVTQKLSELPENEVNDITAQKPLNFFVLNKNMNEAYDITTQKPFDFFALNKNENEFHDITQNLSKLNESEVNDIINPIIISHDHEDCSITIQQSTNNIYLSDKIISFIKNMFPQKLEILLCGYLWRIQRKFYTLNPTKIEAQCYIIYQKELIKKYFDLYSYLTDNINSSILKKKHVITLTVFGIGVADTTRGEWMDLNKSKAIIIKFVEKFMVDNFCPRCAYLVKGNKLFITYYLKPLKNFTFKN